MSIRTAQQEDAARLAYVHITAWRETYRGIMPDTTLDNLSFERSTDGWAKRLAALPDRQEAFVACDDGGQVMGFAVAGPKRLPELPADGEIFAINLIDKAKRKGHVLRLMHAAALHLTAHNFEAVGLWVLERNLPARAFYERLGGTVLTQRDEDFGGTKLIELAVAWNSPTMLHNRTAELISTTPA